MRPASRGPYRATDARDVEAPPTWWQRRVVARYAPWAATEWRWYRRETGGRWCRGRVTDDASRDDLGVTWFKVAMCPAVWSRPPVPDCALVLFPSVPVAWSVRLLCPGAPSCDCENYDALEKNPPGDA